MNPLFNPYSKKELSIPYEKIHKQDFIMEKVPNNLDCIVIGSGIGGLSAAGFMAKDGKRVLVLEQCEKAGGLTHEFSEEGYTFSSGVHTINSCNPGSLFRPLFDYLSDGKLEFSSFGRIFEQVKINNKTYDNMNCLKGQVKYLSEIFPEEKKSIEFFFQESKKIYKDLVGVTILRLVPSFVRYVLRFFMAKTYQKYNTMLYKDLLDTLFKNDELKVALGAMCGYINMDFVNANAAPAMLVQHLYHSRGGWLPNGGSGEISKKFIEVIEKHEGKVLVNAKVEKILLNEKKNKAVGVSIKQGGKSVKIFAKKIISSVGVYTTYKKLLPKEFDIAVKDYIPSPGFLVLYCGFNKPPKDMDFPNHNVHIISSYTDMCDNSFMKLREGATKKEIENATIPQVYIGFPNIITGQYPNDGKNEKSVCEIITSIDHSLFKQWNTFPPKNRGNEYEELKNILKEKVLKIAFEHFPKMEDHLDYVDVATPISTNHWINTNFGEGYGMKITNKRLFDHHVNPKVPKIKGLYLAGSDTYITGGITPTLVGGAVTAQVVLKKGILMWVIKKMIHDRKNVEKIKLV